jgi:hypothetical protein
MNAFASSHFDPNDYANAVLAGDPYIPSSYLSHIKPSVQDPPPKEDISVAISKLTIAIDDVSKQIKTVVRKICFITYFPSFCILLQVATHHEHLLSQAAGGNNLSGSLIPVRGGLNDLESSLEK